MFRPIGMLSMSKRTAIIDCALSVVMAMWLVGCTVSGPSQAIGGLGGADYPHLGVRESHFGEGEDEYWIFEPDHLRPLAAPVVVFTHGWLTKSPFRYRAWVRHIVRQGNIVIYPRFHKDITTPTESFADHATAAIIEALGRLRNEPFRVRPDVKRVVFVGHSAGGNLAISLAAEAVERGLPLPGAVMCIGPGRTPIIPLADLSEVPAEMQIIAIVGDADPITGDQDARRIMTETTAMPSDRKHLLRMHTDLHGNPGLMADHFAPLATHVTGPTSTSDDQDLTGPYPADALDYNGLWKLLDALCAAAFNDRVLVIDEQLLSVGKWSDGRAIKPMTVEQP